MNYRGLHRFINIWCPKEKLHIMILILLKGFSTNCLKWCSHSKNLVHFLLNKTLIFKDNISRKYWKVH